MKKTLNLGFGRRPKKIIFSSSIFLLVGSISTYIPKISLQACFFLKIAMKKTLNLQFGRRPQENYFFSSIFLLVRSISSYIPKMSYRNIQGSHSPLSLPPVLNPFPPLFYTNQPKRGNRRYNETFSTAQQIES